MEEVGEDSVRGSALATWKTGNTTWGLGNLGCKMSEQTGPKPWFFILV